VEARAGNTSEALSALGRAVEGGYADAAVAKWDEDFSSLRNDSQFADLIARMEQNRGERELDTDLKCVTLTAEGRVGAVAINSAGDLAAIGMADGRIQLSDTRTGQQTLLFEALAGAIWNVTFSPDHKWIAALSYDGSLGLFETSSGTAQFVQPEVAEKLTHRRTFGSLLEFSPDGVRLLLAASDLGGSLWSTGGELIRRIERPLGNFTGIAAAWSPDGTRIATIDGATAVLLDGSTGESRETIKLNAQARSIAYSPDGKYLAVGTYDDGLVFIYQMTTGKVIRQLQARDMIMNDIYVPIVRFSPNGEQLAYSSCTSINVMLDAVHEDKQFFTSGFHGGRMGEPAGVKFSPDGSRLWYAWSSGGGVFNQVETESGQVTRLASARVPEVSTSGIAVAATRGGLTCFNANTGTFYWHRTELPDGRHVLQAPAGYLDGDFETPELLLQAMARGGTARKNLIPIGSHLPSLFDPKRVRAAMAGVPLVAISPR
jgi:WD40 repeat protein